MRKFLFALLLFLGVVFFLSRVAEFENILLTLQKGEWYFVLSGFALVAIWLLANTSAYRSIYAIMGIQEKTLDLLPVVLASNFANTIAPSGGASGIAIFVAEARRRKYSPAKVTAASAVYLEFEYLSLLTMLGAGFIVLIRRQHLASAEIIAGGILLTAALILALMIYLGMKSSKRLARLLTTSARLINTLLHPLLRRPLLTEERAVEFACELSEGLQSLRERPRRMLKPFFFAILAKTLQLLTLLLIFINFQVPVSAGTLVASYSLSSLFHIVSPTPAGIGFVEGILALTLASMYVSPENAAVISLTYRALTFWFPLVLGLISFRWLQKNTPAS